MEEQNDILSIMQSEAAIEANDAFTESIGCLPYLLEAAGGRGLKEVLLMTGYMIVFQLSMESRRITIGLNEVVQTIETVNSNNDNNTRRFLECLTEILDNVGSSSANPQDFWMTSDLAAIDKAKEIGLTIQDEWSTADLRYKLHQAIFGGENG